MAERVGFEPTDRHLADRRFSRPLPSTAQPPLHILKPVIGFEPTTDSLQNCCSTAELNWQKIIYVEIMSSSKKLM